MCTRHSTHHGQHLSLLLLGLHLVLGRYDRLALQANARRHGAQHVSAALRPDDLHVDRIGGKLQELKLPLTHRLALHSYGDTFGLDLFFAYEKSRIVGL